jgi:hypothetical protein
MTAFAALANRIEASGDIAAILKLFASLSATSSSSSPPKNAHATWQTQDTDEPNFIPL